MFAPVPIVEPVVHALVVDLEIPDPAHCAATVARAEAVLRSIAARGRSAALPTVHLAPGCRQLPFRFFDASLIEQPAREAEASFPGSAIRPVVLYVNNVDLPLPFGVTEGLRALRFSATAQGRLAPRVYGLALEKARASGGFDAVGSWTHAGDEAMWTAVEELIGRDVPFESTREVTVRAPLLDPPLAAHALDVKLCRVDAGATVIGCGAPGGLCPDAPARLEAFTTFGTFLAAPRGRLPRQDRTVAYEACTERCDRFLEMDEHLRRWPEIAACVVEVTR